MHATRNPRRYRFADHLIMGLSQCIRTLSPASAENPQRTRPSPGAQQNTTELSPEEKKQSAALMRVNHTGEVCAQALYLGQSLSARNNNLRDKLKEAANEERDHLHWCEQRILELDGHTSYLNPLWFTGSLLIGTVAGLVGDQWSLGFLAQTEIQVAEHLGSHLQRLPANDIASKSIVALMQKEEAMHAHTAIAHGGVTLPTPVTWTMRVFAKIMTSVTYYV